MKVLNVNHVGITVKNLKESIRFYSDVMGFKLVEDISEPVDDPAESIMCIAKEGARYRMATMEICDGKLLEMMEFESPESEVEKPVITSSYGATHMSYDVDDVDEWVEKLRAGGYNVHAEPLLWETDHGTAKWCVFKDINGISIELIGPFTE